MTQKWICISNKTNIEIMLKNDVWGVAERYQNIISKVKKGDILLFYKMQEGSGKVIIPSLVIGIFEVISDVYYDPKPLFKAGPRMGNETFPQRIRIKPIKIFKKPIEFKPLIDELSFIKNKKMWSGSLRTAMRVIPEEDYQKIISAEN